MPKQEYMVLVKVEEDNLDPKEGQKGEVQRQTIKAATEAEARKKGEALGEVLEVFAR